MCIRSIPNIDDSPPCMRGVFVGGFDRIIVLAVLMFGPVLAAMAGCAAQEKQPQTVTEWMKQPRVGESLR